ncbi:MULTISPECIES: hypothetical protein [Actinomadura]|uniref:SPOR domain-containing protein n=1 Tax=Actinomadura livida TaxID=79909 RepID=A0A7W7N055_9ACTN|nr:MULTISPECIES: hypothetical protein [Actinomadura]MBB4776570.1 hypothetical protein [Actinomadura catellatispora]TDB96121.1 hypothetical protein E1266_10970 [Actinomadura sp. 7K534]GGT93244.1 hypothetical protein GCM10010208_15340 [Actinomadura livida]
MAGDGGDWWFCLKHMKVEHGPGCPDKDRMGPYESESAAAGALALARERNEAWRRDNGDD